MKWKYRNHATENLFYFSFEWYVTEYLACRKNVLPILCKEKGVLLHPCVVIAEPEMESNSCSSFNSSVCHHSIETMG